MSVNEMCVYMIIALLLKFKYNFHKLSKDKAMVFLQNLPTDSWGYQDVRLLVAETFSIYKKFHQEIEIEKS